MIILYQNIRSRLNKINFLNLFILNIITLIALLLTYSRSSYLAFFAGIFILFLKNKKLLVPTLITLAILVSLFYLPQKFGEGTKLLRISTIHARLINYQESIYFISSKPIFGFGFDTLRYVKYQQGMIMQKWQQTHSGAGLDNSLLFVLATTGFVGLLQFFLLWKNIFKKYSNPVIFASIASLFIHGMFVNSWFYPWVMLWLFFLIIEEEYQWE